MRLDEPDTLRSDLVVIVGHPRPDSRTHGLALETAQLLGSGLQQYGLAPPRLWVVDLAELAPQLLQRFSASGPGREGHGREDHAARQALRHVGPNPLVLMVTPTFRAAYSGLLKVFLDLLPRNGLRGALVMPMVTAGLPDHRGAVQAALRTVLLEMQADLRIPGITLLESEFDHVEKIFEDWWLVHGPALSQVVRQQAADRLARTQSGAERC